VAFVAIIGAGPLGGAIASTLAQHGRATEVRLIDPAARIAEGKALDIQQSSAIEQFSARVVGAADFEAVAGADVIALADLAEKGDISGEDGLAIVRRIARIESSAPLLFCGSHLELMKRAVGELHVARTRVVGSAALALESAVRAIAAALIDASPKDVSIGIAGVPPKDVVIAWDAATVFHQPIARVLAAHHLASLSSRVAGLWPPGPYALASAAARLADALAFGSRRRFTCFAAVDLPGAGRGMIAAVPIEIRKGEIAGVLEPALSRHERTLFENGLR
jgi:malate dehydrogenase